MADPLKVLVTGAAGQIAYSLLYSVANGEVYGKEQHVALALMDSPSMLGVLAGVAMELQDCAFELLQGVVVTDQEEVGFREADVAVLLDSLPMQEGMEQNDLLKANARKFRLHGHALDVYAKKTVKVLVVGDLANTNCLVSMISAPSIPRENFTCLMRLDQNRAQAQLVLRLGAEPGAVSNVTIWGGGSAGQHPDTQHATVSRGSRRVPLPRTLGNGGWLGGDFIKAVQQREAAVVRARGLPSAISAAEAICGHLRVWWCGTKEDGHWKIIPGLSLSPLLRQKMALSARELLIERDTALGVLAKSNL
ncbi:malate dehydrogenase, cytoplasmic-like isoform X2 [Pristis pectinata]|uniref:malate dehydrogenase, cytoplasmic-like isoform X2 n=1 Tax=Pristis pectinata TaxID=685728 RepID=UPI00223D4597|nr:malate dehydrogenase, cytoplasmic-like isoform X2 [Pristis pectinata]